MSGLTLPKSRIAPTRLVPKIVLLYGMHKIGKTRLLSMLDDCLIADFEEEGSAMYENMRVPINSWDDVNKLGNALMAEKTAQGKMPYRFLGVDTIDKMEEMAIAYETLLYNKDKAPKDRVGVITDLDYGRGYGYVRERMQLWINGLAGACEHLIIIGHVKDKIITSKDGIEATSKDLALSGKLGSIICAKVDVIGYMYRDLNGVLRVNFQTKEANPTMGGRFPYLSGKDMEFSWEAIFSPSDEDIQAMQEANKEHISLPRK